MAKRVGAFGEVMMRLAVPGHELLTQASTLHYSFSGTGVNFLAALGSYGHDVYMVTALPNNPLGDAALAHLRKLGIATRFVRRHGDYIGMYFLETGFGPRPSRVTYSNRLASSFNTAPEATYAWERIAAELDMVHFCGITLAMNASVRAFAQSFAAAMHEKGGTNIFDCNFRPALWGAGGYDLARPHYETMLQLADVALMNERDALGVLGLKSEQHSRVEQLIDVIPKVAATYRIQIIAGTQRTIRDDGLHTLLGFMYRDGRFVFSKELTFPVHDRIGAGDAFSSGIVHGLQSGFSDEKTVRFATAASMLAHTITGDTPLLAEADVVKVLTQSAGDVVR